VKRLYTLKPKTGVLLVKCMDSVENHRKHFLTDHVTAAAAAAGFAKVDMLLVYVKQKMMFNGSNRARVATFVLTSLSLSFSFSVRLTTVTQSHTTHTLSVSLSTGRARSRSFSPSPLHLPSC
jgi:hypothetical protein